MVAAAGSAGAAGSVGAGVGGVAVGAEGSAGSVAAAGSVGVAGSVGAGVGGAVVGAVGGAVAAGASSASGASGAVVATAVETGSADVASDSIGSVFAVPPHAVATKTTAIAAVAGKRGVKRFRAVIPVETLLCNTREECSRSLRTAKQSASTSWRLGRRSLPGPIDPSQPGSSPADTRELKEK